jgi:hypothetical protein
MLQRFKCQNAPSIRSHPLWNRYVRTAVAEMSKNVIFLSCTLVGCDGTFTGLVPLRLDIMYQRYKLLCLI